MEDIISDVAGEFNPLKSIGSAFGANPIGLGLGIIGGGIGLAQGIKLKRETDRKERRLRHYGARKALSDAKSASGEARASLPKFKALPYGSEGKTFN